MDKKARRHPVAGSIVERFSRLSRRFIGGAACALALAAGAGAAGVHAAWSTRAPLPAPVSGAAAAVIGDVIYVVGGFTTNSTCSATATVRAYDPASDSWSVKAPLPSPRVMPTVAVVDGLLYAIGGSPPCGNGALDDVQRYDPATDQWTALAPAPSGVAGPAAVAVVGGVIHVAGGFTGPPNQSVGTHLAYDTASGTWSMRPAMPTPRHAAASGLIGGVLYVSGGLATSVSVDTVEAFDPAANTWSARAPMPSPRCCASGVALQGRLWVPGGALAFPTNEFWSYDPAADTWRAEFPMTVARANHALAAVGNVIYAIGGQGPNLFPTTLVETFTLENPNVAPVADAGDDQTLLADGSCRAVARLDGSGSTDADGDVLTYAWSGAFASASGKVADVSLPLGTHSITLQVDDGNGGISADSVVIAVVDGDGPVLSALAATPGRLWPPNHRMVLVTLAAAISDNCGAASCRIVSVASSEAPNGRGDGNTAPDWELMGGMSLMLRSERSGRSGERVYTVTVQCTDESGNVALRSVAIPVAR